MLRGNSERKVISSERSDVPSICADTKNVSLSWRNSYIEQVQERECLSGLIDLPSNIEFNYYFPGYTEIYECKNNSYDCIKRITVSDFDGKTNLKVLNPFPRTFRLKGKPGKSWFRLIG